MNKIIATFASAIILSSSLCMAKSNVKPTPAPTPVPKNYELDFVDVYGEHYQVMIDAKLPMHNYKKNKYIRNKDKLSYEDDNYTSSLGIDISRYQGNVDFEKVKKAGYEFVILRLGYRGYGKSGSLNIDSCFEKNIVKAKDAGLKVGVYFFSQAINEEEAVEEAEFVEENLTKIVDKYGEEYVIDLPVVYDPETIRDAVARTDNVTKEQFTLNTIAFFDEIESNGYDIMLYSNMLWEAYNFDMKTIFDKGYPIWYADYEEFPQTPYEFVMWQYTNTGYVEGIGNGVDIDIMFSKK